MSSPTSSIRLIRRLRLTKICRARSICGRSRGVDNSRESSESDRIFCARFSASDADIRADAGPRVGTKTREDLAETEPGERSDRGNLPLFIARAIERRQSELRRIAPTSAAFLQDLPLAWHLLLCSC